MFFRRNPDKAKPRNKLLVGLGVAAGAFVVLTLVLSFFYGDPAEYAAQAARAEAISDRVAVQTFGGSYTGIIADLGWWLPKQLDAWIDPGNKGGGMYNLRKMMEHLAGLLIWPFLLVAIVHTLFVGGGKGDQRLVNLAIRLFAVLFLLNVYPLWDWVLYRQVAWSITDEVVQGKVATSLITGMANSNNLDYQIPFTDISSRTNIMEGIGDMHSGEECLALARAVEGEGGADEASAELVEDYEETCENDSAERKASHMGLTTTLAGVEAKENTNFLWDFAKGALASVVAFWDTFVSWLTGSVMGVMILVATIITNLVLGGVWLWVIGQRAMHLTLGAPKIAMALLPGNKAGGGVGLGVAVDWFKQHAKIALQPVGVALMLLLIYAMFTGVLMIGAHGVDANMPLAERVLVYLTGPFFKFAFLLALFAALRKGLNLMNDPANAVTAISVDFGHALKEKGVKIAGTVVQTGAIVATGGASAVAGSAGGAAVSAKAGAAGQRLGQVASSMGGKMPGLPKRGVAGGVVQGFKRAAKATAGAGRASVRTAQAVMDNRPADEDAANLSSLDPKRVLDGAKSFKSKTMAAVAQSMEEKHRAQAEAAMEQMDSPEQTRQTNRERESLAEQIRNFDLVHKGGKLEPRPGERIPVRTQPGDFAGAGESVQSDALGLLSSIDHKLGDLLRDGGGFKLNVGAGGELDMPGGSVRFLQDAMRESPEFRKSIERQAAKLFGAGNVPMVESSGESFVDTRALLNRSPEFTAFATAMHAIDTRSRAELFRRERASVLAGAEPDSVRERAVRGIPAEIGSRIEGAPELLKLEADRISRMAARATQKPSASVSELLEAADDSALDGWRDQLAEKDSFTKVDDAAPALEKALAAYSARYDTSALSGRVVEHNGRQYGLDVETLVKSFGEQEAYRADENSVLQGIVDRVGKDNQAQAYEMAVDEVTQAYKDELSKLKPRARQARINELVFLDKEVAAKRALD